jgi:hypothetical protein
MSMQGINRVAVWSVMVLVLLLMVAGCGMGAHGGGKGMVPPTGGPAPVTGHGEVRIEIGYLSHPPIRAAVTEVNKVVDAYGDKVQVRRYDLDTQEGKAFAKQVGLTVHTPLVVYLNGSMEVEGKDGRKVTLFSFPANMGSGQTPGSGWSMDDLKAALERAVGGQP